MPHPALEARTSMRRFVILGLPALLLASPTSSPPAESGLVVKKSGWDYYLVETAMGSALLEWYGGNDPDEGDTLVGEYESYGMKDIFNVTAGSETRVWVEDFWLSRSSAIEKYRAKCSR